MQGANREEDEPIEKKINPSLTEPIEKTRNPSLTEPIEKKMSQ
jgi:hypothetical protein